MNSACAGVRMIHHLSAHCEHWTLGETLHIWLFTPSLHHGASRIRFNKTHGTTSQQHNNGSVLFGVICESFAEFYVTRICSEYATRFFDDIFAYCNNGSVKSSYERRWIFFVLSKRGRFWSLVCQSGIRIFRTERRGENGRCSLYNWPKAKITSLKPWETCHMQIQIIEFSKTIISL